MNDTSILKWPEGKNFAFTVFDDTDNSSIENTKPVYTFLYDNGFLTTKSVWMLDGTDDGFHKGSTCQNQEYLKWVKDLHSKGFEIGYHMASYGSSNRNETMKSLESFIKYFGRYPSTMANHSRSKNNIYWGDKRLSGINKLIYNLLSLGKNRKYFEGDYTKSKYFWGDLCKQNIKYVRNYVFSEINTLKKCPHMPYHDQLKPYVNYWFASTNGRNLNEFLNRITESNQDKLENEGGVCIMYTHFADGFVKDGKLNKKFMCLMKRLSNKNGYFVPVNKLLDHLLVQKQHRNISPNNLVKLETSWLIEKIFTGRN